MPRCPCTCGGSFIRLLTRKGATMAARTWKILTGGQNRGTGVLLASLRYMGREGLLFEQCYRRNRSLWYWTYPFHIGILLIAFWLLLLVVGAVTLQLEGSAVSGSSTAWDGLIFYTTVGAGGLGLSLCLIGRTGLLFKRTVDPDMRLYAVPADYLNLIFTLIVLLAVSSAWCFHDQTFAVAKEYAGSLIGSRPAADERRAFFCGRAFFPLPRVSAL